jgi:hypothetical protein
MTGCINAKRGRRPPHVLRGFTNNYWFAFYDAPESGKSDQLLAVDDLGNVLCTQAVRDPADGNRLFALLALSATCLCCICSSGGDVQRSSFIRYKERNDIVRNRTEILSKDLRRWLQDTQVFVSAATGLLPKRSPPFMKTNLRSGLPSHVTE